ncbi:hypothetical protein RAE08_10765 [Corynebacterium tuberculostearicum]|uniref:hypothetical protein n=1 Tax=Corynebacterium tuberculostearicum TaxID=38304 RepID=UPI0029348E99|nr:hypothetical protein [Corynebacterium tuberculostearicum]MDV2431597.1 hypothetical protein [Corynebacterium tuberculostearicum]
MSYTALLEDYSSTNEQDQYPVFARKEGFSSRSEGWDWVIDKASQIWPGSRVLDDLKNFREIAITIDGPMCARDFAVQEPGDPAVGLRLAVTVADGPHYADASNFPDPQYP